MSNKAIIFENWYIIFFILTQGHFCIAFFFFRKREERREEGRKKETLMQERSINQLHTVCAQTGDCTCPTRDRTHNPDICPDQEPNPQPKHLYWPGIELWPFAFQDDAQLTELYQPGFLCPFLIVICIYLYFAIELHEFLIYFGS